MNFPQRIDLTPDGRILECADIGTEGYAENVEYTLQISFEGGNAVLFYYGEDETILDDIFMEEVLNLTNQP